jgi:hypothetical protein
LAVLTTASPNALLVLISRNATMALISFRSLRNAPCPVTSKVPNGDTTVKLYHVLLSLLSLRTETWGAYMAVAHLLLHHGSRLCALLSGAADALAVAGLGALAVCDLWVGACHGTVE